MAKSKRPPPGSLWRDPTSPASGRGEVEPAVARVAPLLFPASASTSAVTTAPAPTIAPAPTVTGATKAELLPINAPSPITARVIPCTPRKEATLAKTPLQLVKDKFGDKAKLVAAVKTLATDDLWLGRTNEEKGLEHVSNSKLLRLHATFSLVKEKFGTRQKLIDAIADIEKHAKDEGYKARLSAFPVPRLYDQFKSSEKRAKAG